jgi:hypothetical protein
VFRTILSFAISIALWALACAAQQATTAQQPKVKVNMLNVCAPSPDEQQEIASALAKVPRRPSFSPDFEVDRGRSVLDQNANILAASGNSNAAIPADAASADFVRVRRDFAGTSPYATVQYAFSRDRAQMVETLVFRVRDPKDLLQVSIEDSASSVTTAAAMLGASTPASRIKLERFGQSSVVLARCPGQSGEPPPNQGAYEPLFSSASSVLSSYRGVLGARKLVPEELLRIDRTGNGTPAPGKNTSKANPKTTP